MIPGPRPRRAKRAPAQQRPAGTAARVAALAVAAAALACLSATGGVSERLTVVGTALMTAAELFTAQRTPAFDRLLRRYVLPVALMCCVAPAASGLLAAAGDPDLVRAAAARLAAGALVVLPLGGATRRDLLGRLALAAATAGLAVSNVGPGRMVTVPAVLFAVAALGLLALLENDRLRQATAARSQRPPVLVPTLVAVVLAGVLAGLLTAGVHLPPRGGGSARGTAAGAPGRLTAEAGVMDLRRRDPLSSKPVASVATDEPLLWRSSVLTRYDGTSWRATADQDSRWQGRARSDTVVPLDADADGSVLLLSPGQPSGVAPTLGESLGFGAAYRMPAQAYTVESIALDASALPPTAIDAPPSDPAALQLPQVPARVVRLARSLTAGASSRQEAVQRVVSYLGTHYRYRLDSAAPAPGEDAVDDFLFVTREGFCEQFASAAAVLLRSVGIPARLAVGYADGTPAPDGRLLRGTDAHAWVEVEYPSSGWQAVDPTSGVPLASAHGGWWSALRRLGADAGLAALLGIAVGVVLVAALRPPRSARRRRDRDPLAHALARLDRQLGTQRRGSGETLREFGDRLALTPAEADALRVAEDGTYAARAPGPGERQRAAACLDLLTDRISTGRISSRRRGRRRQTVGRAGGRRSTAGR